jgi:hypothetical protein
MTMTINITMPALDGEIGFVDRPTGKSDKKRNMLSSPTRGCSGKPIDETEAGPPRKQAKLMGCTPLSRIEFPKSWKMTWDEDNNFEEANGWGRGVVAVKKPTRSSGKINLEESPPFAPYMPKFERYTWTGEVV